MILEPGVPNRFQDSLSLSSKCLSTILFTCYEMVNCGETMLCKHVNYLHFQYFKVLVYEQMTYV